MAPTSEERRRVAARLRGEEIARNSEDAYVVLLSCIGIRPQLPAVRTYKDAMARMADLIDPTCKNKEERTDNFICSACGETFCADPDGVNFPIDWAYCPCCGARVVRE